MSTPRLRSVSRQRIIRAWRAASVATFYRKSLDRRWTRPSLPKPLSEDTELGTPTKLEKLLC
ncbi:hypothetical protein SNOG_00478 [Parastagonospora nodorum SN15]|uniref:Uncharacterized protein n=1 Tax=Phaeosphaeria nodorum (strain SN15 / ATCC MYA-4574 / FGSC 10173) TaxID=321614 RepID=Q0V686_PHANO|nr:hypothetical protein SNOG_00478 [Parastagonospora nodorum SN15]EAT91973.1 hypothetical protein SNOG_00478 [Parastagonospora nodorum SN15]